MSALFRNLARRKKVQHDQDPCFAPQIRPVPLPPAGSPQYQLQALSPPTLASPSGLGLVWVLVPATPAPQTQNTPLPASPVQQPSSLPSQARSPTQQGRPSSDRPTHAPIPPSPTRATHGSASPRSSTSPDAHPNSQSLASHISRASPDCETTHARQSPRRPRAPSFNIPPEQPTPQPRQQQSPNPVHAAGSPDVMWASPVAQPSASTSPYPVSSPAHQSVLSRPATLADQSPTRATPNIDPAIAEALKGEGSVLLDQDVSFKRVAGICTFSVISPWAATQKIAITRPITVNDLHTLLRDAPVLEFAYLQCVTRDSGRNRRNWRVFEANKLRSLIIAQAEARIGAVLRDLRTACLALLQVSYAEGYGYHLWSDEKWYYTFLRCAQGSQGVISIESKDAWYRDQRAAHLELTLRIALGSERRDWSVHVPS
ncbi:hypothetical protein GGG16DRAFT_58546 [Schizophyllum commune]